MSTLLDEKTITREEVKKAINKCFGNGEDFYLLKTGEESYILLTPFLTQENDLIELCINIVGKKKIFISDFGNIKKAMEKIAKKISAGKIRDYEKIKKLMADCCKGDIKIESGLSGIGLDVLRLISLLQKIYNLGILLELDRKAGCAEEEPESVSRIY